MKSVKAITLFILSFVLFTSFTQCSSSKNTMDKENKENINSPEEESNKDKGDVVEVTDTTGTMQGRGKEMPLFIRDAYFQSWFSGQKAGGSGIHIYFPTLINKQNYKLEKVYFRGMIGDMQEENNMHFANLKSNKNRLVMSNDENAEYGNTKPEPFPFELKPNECMISYKHGDKIKYFQVYNIKEKASVNYPSAPIKHN
ncbi:hypothetical protein CLV86_1790 [Lacinutrix venerupis]|nr:hypothetical protein CLV86_1790 [Lacinutrix venerupis]